MTSLSLSPRHCWQWLAYHHQAAEGALYLMFFSGLLLWEPLTPTWSLARWNLFLHVALSLTLFPLLFGAFWLSHRSLLRKSRKPFCAPRGASSKPCCWSVWQADWCWCCTAPGG